MTRSRMVDWCPERHLTLLLDALTDELLALPDRDLVFVIAPAADPDARRIIGAAESDACRPQGAAFQAPGLRAFISRNQ